MRAPYLAFRFKRQAERLDVKPNHASNTKPRLHLQADLIESAEPMIEYRMRVLGCKTRAEYVRRCVEQDIGLRQK